MVTTTVKKGYKQTELGVIPVDWDVNSFGKCADIYRGGSPRPIQSYLTHDPNGINWIKIGDVGAGERYITSTEEKIIPEGALRSRKVSIGDFLLSNSMSFGRPYILKVNGCIHDGWLTIQNYNKVFNTEYLYYILSSKVVLDQYLQLASGSSVLNLNKAVVSIVKLPIPKIKEQIEIATVLSDTDALIDHLDKLIAKKKGIKQGTMQQLLTGKKRLPGFSEKWEEKKLAEIADFLKGNGLSKSKINNSGQYSCILYGELFTTYSQAIHEVRSRTNSKEGLPSMKGDILMPGSTTTIGIDLATASALHKKDVLIGGDVIVIRKKEQEFYNSDFLANYLTHVSKYKIAGITQGITIIHLHGSRLQEILVKIPKDVNEQTTIATILSDMDNEIERLQQKRDKYAMLKNGMMQQLLTGKIRIYGNK